jgi:xylulokinase
LAGVASGVYASIQEACAQTVRIVERTAPRPENVAVYAQAYETYMALYPALKPIISHQL